MYISLLGRLGKLARVLRILVIASLVTGSGFALSEAQADEWVGTIVLTAADYCRRDTVEANGQPVQNRFLENLIGGRFGRADNGGDVVQSLLPDLRESGSMRWCVITNGAYPSKPDGGGRPDGRRPGEIVALVSDYCPSGWEVQTDAALPHQNSITWCKALENGYAGDDSDSYTGEMQLGSGDGCLTPSAVLADGRALIALENKQLWALLGNRYGGSSNQWDGTGSFNVPDLASATPGTTWCINNGKKHPHFQRP